MSYTFEFRKSSSVTVPHSILHAICANNVMCNYYYKGLLKSHACLHYAVVLYKVALPLTVQNEFQPVQSIGCYQLLHFSTTASLVLCFLFLHFINMHLRSFLSCYLFILFFLVVAFRNHLAMFSRFQFSIFAAEVFLVILFI